MLPLNRHKSETAANRALRDRAHLLSVTIDPQFDTPEVLRSYADHQKADPQVWTFATGEPAQIENLTQSFAVFVQPEGGTISHGLATALMVPTATLLRSGGETRGNLQK